VIAVSPIIGGQAIKGPAAKMMAELGMPQSALAVAKHYVGRIDGFVIDHADEVLKPEIEQLGMRCLVTQTLMTSLDDRIQLADDCLGFCSEFS
jgi:LPPG:FO 2-phospho-L-lactate transferase